ncbi:MAG: hypothetical protein DLM70_01425 [Chloroflexi bacterium]|nr:MAG: hypothetical protein DLM70_01425 [Chloroflexota bacterium]
MRIVERERLQITAPSPEGTVIQYLGRVCRASDGKADAAVMDYCDDHPICWSQWKHRRLTYEAVGFPWKTYRRQEAAAVA